MNSIQRHLTAGLLVSVSVVLLVGGIIAYWAARKSLLDEFDARLLAQARALMAQTEQNAEEIEFKTHSDWGDASATADVEYYELQMEDGSILAKSPTLEIGALPSRWGTLDEPVGWDCKLEGFPPLRAMGLVFQPRVTGKPRKPPPPHALELQADSSLKMEKPPPTAPAAGEFQPRAVRLVVAAERSKLNNALARLRGILFVAGLSALLTAVLAIGWVLRRGLAPLTRLGEEVAKMGADTLGKRFELDDMPQELAPIVQQLNSLLDRMAASLERERRFSADLAHEIRTPLAELRTLVELELPQARGSQVEALREVLDIAVHMESLASRMLALARAEQGQVKPVSEVFPLAGVLKECVDRHAFVAKARSLQVEILFPPDAEALQVQSDATLFRCLVDNLIENAVHYAPAGSKITVEMCRGEKESEGILHFTNPAPELAEADLPHLTERFWRKDAARTETQHWGLGLPLVSVLAKALGMVLRLHLNAAGCLVVSLLGLRVVSVGHLPESTHAAGQVHH